MSAPLQTAAPTGRKKLAQGKERSDAALGHEPQNPSSPEGAKETGWQVVPLGELAADERNSITDGPFGSKLKTEHYTAAGPRVIRLKNIGDGEFVDAKAHISEIHFATLQKHRVFPGDVVIAALGENPPRSCLVPESLGPAMVKADCIRFRAGSRILPKFINYVLNAPDLRRQAKGIIHGVGRPRLNLGEIKALPIPVPPLPEQRRIVAEIEKQFTRLEAGVAALRRVQANLKRYRAAVLKAACEGRLVVPETEWELTTLGQVSTVLAGYGFPERLQGRSTGDFGFFKVGDISEAWKRNEKVLTQANHYISKTDLAELRAKLLPTGTVVFAKIGAAIALNRRAIIGEPSLVDNNVMGLFAGERIRPRYLYHFLCTQKLDDLARATTVPSIRKGDVEGIQLSLPPLEEQTRIVAEVERRLSVVEEIESVVSANLQRATRLRQSILQKAFTGQ
jgi:type I restriction enzyme S subunit